MSTNIQGRGSRLLNSLTPRYLSIDYGLAFNREMISSRT